MSKSKDIKFCLKVMINKERKKVLFAEADSSFADVLISFLTMPLGTVVRTLANHYEDEAPTIGSLTSLYDGFVNLDSANFWSEGCKKTLLNPTIPFGAERSKLKLDISDTQPANECYFFCGNCPNLDIYYNPELTCRSIYYDAAMCCCGKLMVRRQVLKKSQDAGAFFSTNTTAMSFIISEDLKVFPNIPGLVQTLRNLGITDTNGAETYYVTFGFNEIMNLLKSSLLSPTPLTDVILKKRKIFAGMKYEAGVSLRHIKNEATSNSKKMSLKVILQKSKNKLLFAHSDEEFVDFLCSLLAVPLGGVEYLLGGNTGINSIDNLNMSMLKIDNKYLETPDMKIRLAIPKLPHGSIPENHILPLEEETHPSTVDIIWGTVKYGSTKFLKGKGKYVKGPGMYEITDDLTVRPLCMTSFIADLGGLNIPLHDIQELDLEIGLEQALSIVKASLTSSSALTDGLKINTVLRKQPKQEH